MSKHSFLKNDKIYLRPFSSDDLQIWSAWFNDSEVTKYMNKGMFPVTQSEQADRLNNMKSQTSAIQLAIIVSETDKLIGTIGLHKIDWVHRTADVSILIGECDAQGKGYGKQAIALMVHHAFTKLNLHKVTAGMWSNNKGSENAFKSNGFQLEGCRKEQYFHQHGYVDELNYGLLRSEWKG